MTDLGLTSPNEKRDGDYTVKVLPVGVNITDHMAEFKHLTQMSVKNTRRPRCGTVSLIQVPRNSVSVWISANKVRTLGWTM